MRFFHVSGLLILMLASGLVGCAGEEATGTPQHISNQPTAINVNVKPVDAAGFDAAIQQFHGKVVVVDFWQTTCESCVYEFPRLVQLHDKLAAKGLATVSMNLDDPATQNVEQRIKGFLAKKKADFTNMRLAAGQVPNDWINTRLKLTEGLPGQRVYDRQGKLVQTFTGGNDYEDIETLVNRLLKQPGS